MKNRRSGFTLIELMTVMIIMGLMMFIAVGAFKDWGRSVGMRGAVLGVQTSLNLARQRAITHRDRVYFTYGNNSDTMGTSNGYYYVRNDEEVLSKTNYLARGIFFEGIPAGTNNNLQFKLDGTCNSAIGNWNGSVSPVAIREQQGMSFLSRTVSVYRLTGRARIGL